MDFLIGSPFSSPVGQRIQRATGSNLQAEDWGLNMEICDIINETEDGPKDAMKAIKKKIVGNKNFREVMLALTVLETCVKNCGHRFHVQVCTRDFVEGVLVRAILPKNNPPAVLHDRVLSLIQAWADAFRNSPSLSGVVCVYDDLRRRGLEFPMTDLDALSPIHTPQRSTPENETSTPSTVPTVPAPTQAPTPSPAPPQNSQPPSPTDGPVSLSSEQRQKLQSELDLVKGNLRVMTEMLNQSNSSESTASDRELLQQLNSVCKSMQQRVVELIPRLLDEALIGELLVVNDDLNNAFIRYDRFERCSAPKTTTVTPEAGSHNLIDLSPVSPPSYQSVASPPVSQPAVKAPSNQTSHPGAAEEEEFDMFANTRGSSLAEQRKSVRYEDPRAVEGLAEALDTRFQVTGADDDVWAQAAAECGWMHSEGLMSAPRTAVMSDIENWLSPEPPVRGDTEGVTSDEFDKFLQERAKVADHLPRDPKTSNASSRPPPQAASKQERSHDHLFTL
ncbi:target of Myb protein 1-like isoform X1 [Alosa sapidissima]|uniref:target of Myb protein 1-like isoform X1 n=1 Tax=Alosa sapidissima TaxID=34773 RepID=UPI001C09897F|nr:target of Myb protein 1-like isoform X1 [Alosa sapidissima]